MKLEHFLLVASLLAASCKSGVAPPIGEDRPGPPQRGGVLRAAVYTDIRSLDPAVAFDTASSTVEGFLYDTLVSYDARGKLGPQLAKNIQVSNAGKHYRFTLRSKVRFHDGVEMVAQDVKRSIERALHHDTPCPIPSFYERISGYEAFHSGKAKSLEGVVVEGKYGLSIHLSESDATFLHVLALPTMAPVCRSAGSTWKRSFSSRACGTGPFKLTHFEPGQVVRLQRHSGYWQKGLPHLDGIEWQLSMQSFTQRFKFEKGDIDYMREFNDSDSMLYRSSPAWKGRGQWEVSMTTGGVFMNTEMPPFDNRHLRRAVSFALDHSQIAMTRLGHVRAHPKIVPEAILKAPKSTKLQYHDLGKAREEMKLAGFPYDPTTGEGGYPRDVPYLALMESFGQQAAEIYQQQLARIGIKIRLNLVGWSTFLAKTSRRRTTPMGTAGWHADFPDASDFFEPILSTKAIQEEESQNIAFFSNAELDALLARARASSDAGLRRQLYTRAEEIVAREAPWAVGYSYRYFELWHPYLHGYVPHPVYGQYLRWAWIDESQQKRHASLSWLPRTWQRRVLASRLIFAGGSL